MAKTKEQRAAAHLRQLDRAARKKQGSSVRRTASSTSAVEPAAHSQAWPQKQQRVVSHMDVEQACSKEIDVTQQAVDSMHEEIALFPNAPWETAGEKDEQEEQEEIKRDNMEPTQEQAVQDKLEEPRAGLAEIISDSEATTDVFPMCADLSGDEDEEEVPAELEITHLDFQIHEEGEISCLQSSDVGTAQSCDVASAFAACETEFQVALAMMARKFGGPQTCMSAAGPEEAGTVDCQNQSMTCGEAPADVFEVCADSSSEADDQEVTSADSSSAADDQEVTSADSSSVADDQEVTSADSSSVADDQEVTSADSSSVADDQEVTSADSSSVADDQEVTSADSSSVADDQEVTSADSSSVADDQEVTSADSSSVADDQEVTSVDSSSVADDQEVTSADSSSVADDREVTSADSSSVADDQEVTSADSSSVADDQEVTSADSSSVADDQEVTSADSSSVADDQEVTVADSSSVDDGQEVTSADSSNVADDQEVTIAVEQPCSLSAELDQLICSLSMHMNSLTESFWEEGMPTKLDVLDPNSQCYEESHICGDAASALGAYGTAFEAVLNVKFGGPLLSVPAAGIHEAGKAKLQMHDLHGAIQSFAEAEAMHRQMGTLKTLAGAHLLLDISVAKLVSGDVDAASAACEGICDYAGLLQTPAAMQFLHDVAELPCQCGTPDGVRKILAAAFTFMEDVHKAEFDTFANRWSQRLLLPIGRFFGEVS